MYRNIFLGNTVHDFTVAVPATHDFNDKFPRSFKRVRNTADHVDTEVPSSVFVSDNLKQRDKS
jgi:hypothetical protein